MSNEENICNDPSIKNKSVEKIEKEIEMALNEPSMMNALLKITQSLANVAQEDIYQQLAIAIEKKCAAISEQRN